MDNTMTKEQFDILLKRFDIIEAKVANLPDKSQIYTASFAIHGVIWATILGTIIVLNTFGAFSK